MSAFVKNLPNLLTICNLLTGTVAIVEIFTGDYQRAIYYVVISAIFDFLDGFAARILHVKSEMGAQLDSLADMVSFSVVPALFLFRHMQAFSYEQLSYMALLVAAFSAWRLAKFNIDESQSDVFKGLPTPANAVMITSLIFASITDFWLWALVIAASCMLLVINTKMLALKLTSFGLRGNEWRYSLILISVALVAFFGLQGVVFIIPSYIFLSFLANFTGRKSST